MSLYPLFKLLKPMKFMTESLFIDETASGPILDPSRPLGVVSADDQAEVLGRAYLTGWRIDGKKVIATYRLVIGCIELSGLFTSVERRFEPLVA
jgi:hypothetical protein